MAILLGELSEISMRYLSIFPFLFYSAMVLQIRNNAQPCSSSSQDQKSADLLCPQYSSMLQDVTILAEKHDIFRVKYFPK